MRKYFLVQELNNGEYKKIDSSFSKQTIKNRQELQKKINHLDLKIISIDR